MIDCLGSDHQTIICAACLTVFLWLHFNNEYHVDVRNILRIHQDFVNIVRGKRYILDEHDECLRKSISVQSSALKHELNTKWHDRRFLLTQRDWEFTSQLIEAWWHLTNLSLANIMACPLFGANHLPKPRVACCQYDPYKETSWYYFLYTKLCI